MSATNSLRTSLTSALKQSATKSNAVRLASTSTSTSGSSGPWFDLTNEQKSLIEMTEKFTREEIIPRAAEYDKSMDFPVDIFKKAWELGFANSSVPVKYGGMGMGLLDRCLVGEKLSYGCTGIATAISNNGLGQAPLILFGNEEQKKEYLGRCTAEPIPVAYATTEPGAGSDVAAIKTRAEKNADGDWVINGEKMWITNGGVANW